MLGRTEEAIQGEGWAEQVELVQPEARGEGQALIMVHASWQSPRAMIDVARLLSFLVKGVLAEGLPSMQVQPFRPHSQSLLEPQGRILMFCIPSDHASFEAWGHW